MNKIYKVIWSKAKHTYVVASEIAKGHTKGETTGKGLKKLAAAMLVAAALLSPSFAWAADTVKVEPAATGSDTAVEVYTKDKTDILLSGKQDKIGNSLTIGGTTITENGINMALEASPTITVTKQRTGQTTTISAESVTSSTLTGENGVSDGTTNDGDYVKKSNTVGDNLDALDTQVKANTDQFTTDKTSTALHVSTDGNLIVGTKENQIVKNMKINGQLTSGSVSTGNITATGDVTVTGKMAADGVTDETTQDGAYIKQNNTVGNNLVSLDTQVKANADAINEEAQKRKYSVTNLEKADAAEAQAREDGDKALDERITNVKEYVLSETNNNYVSKTDAAVQDGAIVKAANTIGDNVTKLDAALAKETAARLGADAAQDKVIQQVNQNMVDGFNTINKNMADGFTALNNADLKEAQERAAADAALDDKITAETAGRVTADTKLVEAVNSGVSLSDDNVLQKNTTTIDAQGNVTTSKTDANEMILNKGKDNQITLNEKGIKVGTNSSVMDANGVYTGGDTYSEAKAALKSDGSIKGADGKFTVNSANGTVSVNDQIELNGATGVVKSNGLNVGDGNFKVNSSGGVTAAGGMTTLASDGSIKVADGKFTVNSNGGVKAADGKITLSSDGSVTAADGKFTVNSNGGVKAADGKITLSSDGSVKAADGKFTVDTNGAVKAANGNTTIDSNGNVKTAGTLSAADGSFKVDSTGKITSTGLDAGNGTIQTTGTVQAGDVKTGTLETTGDATIGGDLDVKGDLVVEGEFNAKTLSSKLDENNYTTINGGKTQSMNLKMDAKTGEIQASASTFDETGSNAWAKDDDSIGKSSMTADKISQSLSDTGDNPKNIASRELSQNTDNKYEITDSVVEGNQSNVENRTADTTDSQISLKDDSGTVLNKSYITQNLKKVLMGVEEGNNKTTIEQDANNITNTAENGTITNTAKDLVNTASENMTNTVGKDLTTKVGGNMSTTVTGTVTEDFKSDLTTTIGGNKSETVAGTSEETVTGKKTETYGGLETAVNGDEKHTVSGSQTNEITGSQTNTIGGDQTTTVTGDSSLTAENINNDAKSSIVSKVSNDAGSNTSTQLSYQTTEEMSQADGKTASYLRGAAEEKSQLTDGDNKTTIDTVAGQTNTNITDGTSTSNNLQKADQVASSVKNGDNQTVSNQNAESLASSATDGTNTTVANQNAKSFSSAATYGTNTSVVSQDAKSINSAVTDGTNSTGIRQDAQNIALSANNGTIAASAKNINNTATEKLSNSAADIENKASKSILNQVGENTSWKMTDGTVLESIEGADGQTNTITDTADSTVKNVKNGSNELTSTTSSTNADLTITNGSSAYTKVNTATGNKETVKEGENLASTNLTKDGFNVYAQDENGHNTIINNASGTTQTIQTDDKHLNVTTKTVGASDEKLTSGSSVIDVLKSFDDAANPAITSSVTDGTNTSEVKQTAKDITNTAKNGTITNDAKDLVNKASENMTNTVGKDLTTTVGGEMKTTVTGKTTEAYNGGLETTVTGEEKHTVNGNQTNIITGTQTTTVTGDVTEDYKANLSTTVGGNQTTTVIGDSSLSAKNITNTASETLSNSAKNISNTATEKLSNSAAEIENTASKSIKNSVGDNVSSSMTTSTITESVKDGTKSNTFTKSAEKDINIVTDGTNTSTESQLSGSVNTSLKNETQSLNNKMTLANEDGKAEDVTKITDTASGAFSSSSQKADSITNTVKDGNGSNVATEKALSSESKLTSGNSVIDVIKSLDDAANPAITSSVTDGTNKSEVKQTASEVSTSAKDISNTAAEKITSQIGDGTAVKSEMTADGITNTAEGGTIYNKSKDILNEASGDILNFADGEIGNVATKITNITGDNTVTSDTNGTTFENKAHSTAIEEGTVTKTTISGNTLETGKATMDYAEVMKDLGVRGKATIDGDTSVGGNLSVTGTSTLTGEVTMKSNATVEKDLTVKGKTTTETLVVKNGATIAGGATVTGGTTTDTLKVTGSSEFDGKATFNDIVTMKKGLSVTGGVTADTVTAESYKVGDKTYIDKDGINANNQVIRNVGQGDISEGSTDAVSGGQLYETNTRVSGLETRMGTVETKVDKLDNKIDKVGANAAAMANLHPLEFDEDSKWNIAAAVGSSGSETASAVGVFYRPNENVMVNASAAMGTGENMFGGGVSLRLGHGSNKAKDAQMKAAAKENRELRAKVDDLTARMDALLSVLNPNMSKDFPDVPENHWAYEAVSRLAGNGIVEGYEDGKYHGERQMTRYEMAEIIYNALSKGAKAEKKLVEEFRPELQAMAAQKKA